MPKFQILNVKHSLSLSLLTKFNLSQSTFSSFHLDPLFLDPILFIFQANFQSFIAFKNNKQDNFENLKLDLKKYLQEINLKELNAFSESKSR